MPTREELVQRLHGELGLPSVAARNWADILLDLGVYKEPVQPEYNKAAEPKAKTRGEEAVLGAVWYPNAYERGIAIQAPNKTDMVFFQARVGDNHTESGIKLMQVVAAIVDNALNEQQHQQQVMLNQISLALAEITKGLKLMTVEQ